jgi:hypothetical protein
MPFLGNILLCASAVLATAAMTGLPLARRLVADRAIAETIAPIAGWAVFSALALPILSLVGFTRSNASLLAAAALLIVAATLLLSRRRKAPADGGSAAGLRWAYPAAALLAVLPALAVWPKLSGGGMVLAEPMFDHSKVAIVDDMIRLGLPPGNPFYGGPGIAGGLPYYYLWHFSAALFGIIAGANGWEADIALTWFTAFASLALMIGLAAAFGRRGIAALLVLALSLAGSLRPLLQLLFGPAAVDRAFSDYQWPHGWLFQASWAPQHLAAAACIVVAMPIVVRLAMPRGWPLVPLLGVVAAAGFECSAWVGGIVFAASAIPLGIWLLSREGSARRRWAFLAKGIAAALVAAAIALPFLRDEFAAAAARQAGLPIAFRPYRVLGEIVPAGFRHILDVPAYWLILLVVELPATYPAGVAALVRVGREIATERRRPLIGFAVLAGVSLAVPWLFASTVANNDLGWRGVLPAVLVLTGFAAAGLSRWLTAAPAFAAAALLCLAAGIPDGIRIAALNATGTPANSAAALARSPQLWAAVRRHAAPDERVGNNPLSLADSVRWPVDISWALFADRRSCYAGWNLARAFVPLPEDKIDRLEGLFERVFAGIGTRREACELAQLYDCRTIVVTPADGAWHRDPFAASGCYREVEQRDGGWRIYRAVENAGGAARTATAQPPLADAAVTRTKVAAMRAAARNGPPSDPATLDRPAARRR